MSAAMATAPRILRVMAPVNIPLLTTTSLLLVRRIGLANQPWLAQLEQPIAPYLARASLTVAFPPTIGCVSRTLNRKGEQDQQRATTLTLGGVR